MSRSDKVTSRRSALVTRAAVVNADEFKHYSPMAMSSFKAPRQVASHTTSIHYKLNANVPSWQTVSATSSDRKDGLASTSNSYAWKLPTYPQAMIDLSTPPIHIKSAITRRLDQVFWAGLAASLYMFATVDLTVYHHYFRVLPCFTSLSGIVSGITSAKPSLSLVAGSVDITRRRHQALACSAISRRFNAHYIASLHDLRTPWLAASNYRSTHFQYY
ncbi:hypothetical protein BC629DRAFT_1434195 [Irpex lacteus]|nr:hypothetical protein BC629DRAFT_1434195 [Irpex lacteus]